MTPFSFLHSHRSAASTRKHTAACATSLVLAASSLAVGAQSSSKRVASASTRTQQPACPTRASFGRLPLAFEQNTGQTNKRVQFLSRGAGYTLFLTPTRAVLSLPRPLAPTSLRKPHCETNTPAPLNGVALHMRLLHANERAQARGEAQQAGSANYFVGKDPAQWRTHVHTFGRVRYQSVYPGIDLLYYGSQQQLEYDFIVKPHQDYRRIVLQFAGAKDVAVDQAGNLALGLPSGRMMWKKPLTYQTDARGQRHTVASRYVLDSRDKTVRFAVGKYDRSRPLVLDPRLSYSTYIGGSGGNSADDSVHGIVVDKEGSAYVMGTAASADFPTTAGAFKTTNDKGSVFIAKFNPMGTALVYSTFLGNSDARNNAIAVDGGGNAYVSGYPGPDFPTTPGAFQTSLTEVAASFITKLNAYGTALVYSTFFNGSFVNGIAVDGAGNAYVTGTSVDNLPVTPGAFQTTNGNEVVGNRTAFVTKLNPTGTALVYSTYLGSNSKGNPPSFTDNAYGIAVDSGGNAYVVGSTDGNNFPVTAGAPQTTNHATVDRKTNAFVTKMNPTGTGLVYSTYLGGSKLPITNTGDVAQAVALDSAGNAYVTGYSYSADFPTTLGAFQRTNKASSSFGTNAFVTKINPTGTAFVYSTFVGGRNGGGGNGLAIAVDSKGRAYITGVTEASDYPVTPNALQSTGPESVTNIHSSTILTKLNAAGTNLLYSTYLHGSTYNLQDPTVGIEVGYAIALDSRGNTYIGGETNASDFFITSGAFQKTNRAYPHANGFVSKLVLTPPFDFNDDDHVDLLWQNQTTGELAGWLLNGTTYTGSVSLQHPAANWNVVGTGCFHAAVSANDLLFRNIQTGDVAVWYMSGNAFAGSSLVAAAVPLAWKVVACADLNGDGSTDILWQNTTNGDIAVWYMNGSRYVSNAAIANAVPLVWQVAGSADLNNDGNPDLLWRNSQTGEVAYWLLKGTKQAGNGTLATSVSSQWRLAAVGELQQVGKASLIWQNSTTGEVSVWQFSEATHFVPVALAANVSADWRIVGPK